MSAASVDDPFLRRELRGFRLLAARVAAAALGALALFLFIRGIPGALARASERAQLVSTEVSGASKRKAKKATRKKTARKTTRR
jgi:hypothetical protein